MLKIAVFASGNGSNFQNLVDAERSKRLKGNIKLLISDKPNSLVVRRAEKLNVPILTFDPKHYIEKKDYEEFIVQVLKENNIDLIILAGYMRLIGETLLKHFEHQIINLHPSLLPAFPGKNAIEQAFNYGVKYTGVTVHFVDEGMDTGPIIEQEMIRIEPHETMEILTEKIHAQEHQLLINAVNHIASGQVKVKGRKVELHSK